MTSYFAHHNPTKVQHQNLSTEELKKKLLEDTNLNNWLIWKPGMAEWKCAIEMEEIKDLLKSLQTPPPLPMPPPLPPEIKSAQKSGMKSDDDFMIIEFVDETQGGKPAPTRAAPAAATAPIEPKKAIETPAKPQSKRKHPRIKGRLRTIITNRERAFITYTRDISLGGVLLEHAIPDELLKGSVDIFITGPTGKDSIVFRCQPVENQNGQYRFTFVGTDEKNQVKLTTWLDSLGQAQ